jgi:ATP-binding protein involved in chromosome partitioning
MIMPHSIHRRDDGLLITWVQDGPVMHLRARDLRLACPCAACHDEMTGTPLLDPLQVSEGIQPRAVALVGTYGIRISWSDGHDTGIYTFPALGGMVSGESAVPDSANA